MSIEINKNLCVSCAACSRVCLGTLIRLDDNKKSFIKRPERCWGCASCVKECGAGAISLFIGEDIGGLGGRMTAKRDGTLLHWTIKKSDGATVTVTTDSRDSNKY